MYIKNAKESLNYQDKSKFFSCDFKIANHLMTFNKIPVLFNVDEKYYFARTDGLEEALKELPSELEVIDGG